MNIPNKILFGLLVFLLIVAGVFIWWQKVGFEKSYYAVYLDSGDLYFGKLYYFPKTYISNVWFLERGANTESTINLLEFKKAFWGPEDKIYLNREKIVWKAKLEKESPLLKYIKSGKLEEPLSQGNLPAEIQAPGNSNSSQQKNSQ